MDILKIVLKKGQKLFFISDTHYNHHNMCSATTEWSGSDDLFRVFDSLEEMNDRIVENINNCVGEDDIIIHSGDWSFGGIDSIWKFRKRIKCKNIYLTLGNHDHHIAKNKILPEIDVAARSIFSGVYDILEIDLRVPGETTKDRMKKLHFIVSHYPITSWKDMNRGFYHIHGHTHLQPEDRCNNCKAIDVGLEGNDLFPNNYIDIVNILSKQQINNLILKKDRHKREVSNVSRSKWKNWIWERFGW